MTKKSKIIAIDFKSSKQNEIDNHVLQRIELFKSLIIDNNVQNFLFWKMYRDEFRNCSNDYFELINKTKLNLFRFFFKKRNVWISTNIKISIVNALMNVLKKKTRSKWTTKKITECYQKKKLASNDLYRYVSWLNNNKTKNENFKSKISQHQNWKQFCRISILSSPLFPKRKRERSFVSQQLKLQSKQSKHQNENQSNK